jgi:hypothetical protein
MAAQLNVICGQQKSSRRLTHPTKNNYRLADYYSQRKCLVFHTKNNHVQKQSNT